MHIALVIEDKKREEIKSRLQQRKIDFREIGGAVYLKDPNGLGIELMANR